MGTYTGTNSADTITPFTVSKGVISSPSGSRPSAAADTIYGGDGADYLDGAGGNDHIYGGVGNDRIYGGDGDDIIYGKPLGLRDQYDSDTIYGGNGNDTIYGNGGEDDTGSLDGNDTIYGGNGNDKLYGKIGNDTLYGGEGNDRVAGYIGNDTLYGENGADFMRGGDGLDRISSGAGNDIYDYDYVTDSKPGAATRDVILDYNGVGAAAGDVIDLSTIDANTGVTGNQAFVFKGSGAITGPGQVHVVASGTNTLIQANIGGTTAPELEILVADGTALHTQWVATDFIL